MRLRILLVWIWLGVMSTAAYAGVADVVQAYVECADKCVFTVTVLHEDEGWDHYADRFEILSMDRTILATRVLHHPHVDEQPFTRSLREVDIPVDVTQVIVRAHDLVHGYGGEEIQVEIPKRDKVVAALSVSTAELNQ